MLRIHIYLVIIRLRPLRKIWIRIRPKVKIRIQGFLNVNPDETLKNIPDPTNKKFVLKVYIIFKEKQ